MEIYLTSKFKKSYTRLPEQIKRRAEAKEKLFKQNPFYSPLKTHPLRGKYEGCWAFSVNKLYRIIFQFLDAAQTKVAFVNIGTHEIYK